MNKLLARLLCAAGIFACAFAPSAFPAPAFTLLHYNVKGNGVSDFSTNTLQVKAIGREVMYLQPDIVAFNEIPNSQVSQMTNFVRAFLPGYYLATNSVGDGFIRSVILSRYPIVRSQSWLHGTSLTPYGGGSTTFTRDLFEAQITVPGFPQPLHVFTTHLKCCDDGTTSAARRAGEAGAISNFFVTVYATSNSLHPYTLSGDLNEDIIRPGTYSVTPGPIQRLISPPTGLQLTTPVNPFTGSELTISIQSLPLDVRFDYILPCSLLFSNIASSQVFRTDLLPSPPPPLLAGDDATASDHLPVLMTFNNPYDKPFRLLSVTRSNLTVTLQWESVLGQPYRVESSTNLTTWGILATNFLATNSTCTYKTNLNDRTRFFRVYRGL
jgi:endonuclease/exonuclease/phosphatase family metal-dependent hydrolase